MSGNGDMNAWIRRGMTPKHALEAFVGLLNGQAEVDHGSPDAPQGDTQGAQDPPRRRVDANAGEGQGPGAQPEAGGTAHQAMNRLLKEAVRNKDRG